MSSKCECIQCPGFPCDKMVLGHKKIGEAWKECDLNPDNEGRIKPRILECPACGYERMSEMCCCRPIGKQDSRGKQTN